MIPTLIRTAHTALSHPDLHRRQRPPRAAWPLSAGAPSYSSPIAPAPHALSSSPSRPRSPCSASASRHRAAVHRRACTSPRRRAWCRRRQTTMDQNGTGIAIPTSSGDEAASTAVHATKRAAPPDTQEGTEKKRKRRRGSKRRRMAAKSWFPPAALEKNTDCSLSPQRNNGKGSKDTDSSDYSSPLRRPKPLLVEKTTSNGEIVYEYNSDQEVVDAYHKDLDKYHKKLARQQQLPTLKPYSCARNITDWDNLKQKNAVLDVAESVLRLSSSHDGKEINSCSGIIIEWDESDQSAIVVTSSRIIATKVSLDDWEDNNVYAPNAKVTAHLLDGTTSDLTLLYFSKHYEVAFFKAMGASKLQVASLEPDLEFGSEACVLAREKDFGLICRRTKILALDPCDHQRNHYLFIGGSIPESCTGGSLADFNRKVVGMVVNALPNFAFIPSSIIIRCLRLWQSFKKIARPHLGLKLRTVQFLDITHLEQLSRDFKIKVGLIVGKVSSESLAERNGFRTGDVIFSCRGESVSTISEFEGILLDICEKQFEEGKGLNDEVDVEIGVHRLRNPAMRRMVTLSVKLSHCMEAFD